MLLELTIRNFATIEELSLNPTTQLNVLTGETGAGKSIIIDALGALLGQRVTSDVIRWGAEAAYLEGVFQLESPTLSHLMAEQGLPVDEGTLILGREISRSGRSLCRINGRVVLLGFLQQFGQALVDIHGQSEHLSLLRPGEHIDFLDRYAGLLEERKAVAEKVASLRRTREEASTLAKNERERLQRADLLRHAIAEIGATKLRPQEEEELAAQQHLLANAERLAQHADSAFALLQDGYGRGPAVADLLGQVGRELRELAAMDPSLEEAFSLAEGLQAQAQEMARTLRSYRDGIEFDPAMLASVEERLDLIHRLKRKYGSSVAEVLTYAQDAEAELASLENGETRREELAAQEAALLEELGQQSAHLSEVRTDAAERMSRAVEAELGELQMPKASFQVQTGRREAPDGVAVNGKRYAFDAQGIDEVEFLVSLNPGEPLKPLAKVASGGETARLMLALKCVLREVDPVETLIFDEIDTGVGGRSGQVLGEKLFQLSRQHQVICITHLPQVASFGDSHFFISKFVEQGRTLTKIEDLSGERRVRELAQMLGQVTSATEQSAREMLRQVEQGAKRGKQGSLLADAVG